MTKLFLIILLAGYTCITAEAREYGVAIMPAPILNTPDFKYVFGGTNGLKLKTDQCGQVRELEYVALPGSVFNIIKTHRTSDSHVYQVETTEYQAPPHIKLYVDSRFIRLSNAMPTQRKPSLPHREEILSRLRASTGSSYVWGGNSPGGIPELATWFFKGTSEIEKQAFILTGLDCSGLLYHATGGWTPRNTSQLLTFGKSVLIAGKTGREIAALLKPLDLIVWNGHVIVVLDGQTVIESRLECGKPGNGGVVCTPLMQRIAGITRTRRPANIWPRKEKLADIFVVRRWYSNDKEP